MTNERADSKGRSTSPSTPEKETLQPLRSSFADLHIPDAEVESAPHHIVPQHSSLGSQTDAQLPTRGSENTPISSSDQPERQFDSFIFVNEHDLQSSRNNEVRKAIRSHVRKGTHLKQKRLNEASRPDSTVVKKILKRPNLDVEDRSSIGISQTLRSRDEYDLTPWVATTSQSADSIAFPSRIPINEGQVAEAGPSTVTSGPLLFQGGLGASTSNLFGHPDVYMETLSDVSRYQVDSNTPYSLLLENGAPMLYLHARNWPFPQPLRGPRPAVSIWMPSTAIPVPNAHNPRPCLLKSAGTVPWIINSLDYFQFKDETIRWVNYQLQQPGLGTSETTMGVIVCLMTWEIARGNLSEITHHMDGLQKIINLRGNIPDARHFDWKIQFVDLLVAIATSSRPRLQFQFQRPIPPPHHNPSIGTPQAPDSPLFGSNPLESALDNSAFCEQSIKILQHMRDLTETRQFSSHDSMIGVSRTQRSFEPHPSSSTLLRIIRLTASIYNRALEEPPTPFSSPVNHQAMEQICREVEDEANDETWIRYPGVFLWIILTAGAAAAFRAERSFFIMFLMRVGTSAAWWGPEEARLSLLRFLWVKRRSEGLEARIWAGG